MDVLSREVKWPVMGWAAAFGAVGVLSAVGDPGPRWTSGVLLCASVGLALTARLATRSAVRLLAAQAADETREVMLQSANRTSELSREWSQTTKAVVAELRSAYADQLQAAQQREQGVKDATLAWAAQYRRRVEEIGGALSAAQDRVAQGDEPATPVISPASAQDGLFGDVDRALSALGHVAVEAVVRSAAKGPVQADSEQLDVLAKVALRLGSQATRVLVRFDELVRMTEDPDALGDLFAADHLVTQMRRDIEAVTVLAGGKLRSAGGAAPVQTVLRESVQEVADFGRVEISAPVNMAVVPYARSGLIHVVAAFLDNATRYSRDKVRLSAVVEAGALLITVDDHGMGVHPDVRPVENELLAVAPPPRELERERMREGRIGHLVVGRLAREYGLRVELRPGAVRGTQALVVVPPALLQPGTAGSTSVGGSSGPPSAVSIEAGSSFGSGPAHQGTSGRHPSGLPQRLKQQPRAATAVTGRPGLPRRSAGAAPALGIDPEPGGPPPSPTAGLAGAFLTGARQAQHEDVAGAGPDDNPVPHSTTP